MTTWTEVSFQPSEWRYQTLSEELRKCGVENKFESLTVQANDDFLAAIENAKTRYSQIRFGRVFAEKALEAYPDLPANLLNLRAVDALVPELDVWWPRCFYFDGVMRALVRDMKDLDLGAGVFVMGGSWEARVIVAAVTRAGFNKVLLSDVDEPRGLQMIKELQRLNFNVKFEFVQRQMVTQLPGTCAVAVNVLSLVEYPDLVADLSYLNFLRPDGVWMETIPYKDDSPLTTEALSLGTQVEPAVHLLSNVDEAWVERCFNVQIDLKRYREALSASLKNHN